MTRKTWTCFHEEKELIKVCHGAVRNFASDLLLKKELGLTCKGGIELTLPFRREFQPGIRQDTNYIAKQDNT
jgi:hypothetical protein